MHFCGNAPAAIEFHHSRRQCALRRRPHQSRPADADPATSLPRGTVHYLPHQVPHRASLPTTRSRCTTTATSAIDVELSFEFEADFADIFEVRGEKRTAAVRFCRKIVDAASVTLAYQGLDHIRRSYACRVLDGCMHAPHEGGITVPVHLEPQGETSASRSPVECRARRKPTQRRTSTMKRCSR